MRGVKKMKAGIVIGAVIVAALVIGVAAYGLGLFGGGDEGCGDEIPVGSYAYLNNGARVISDNSDTVLDARGALVLDAITTVTQVNVYDNNLVLIKLGTGVNKFLDTSAGDTDDWRFVNNDDILKLQYKETPTSSWKDYNGSEKARTTVSGNTFTQSVTGTYENHTITLNCIISHGINNTTLSIVFMYV